MLGHFLTLYTKGIKNTTGGKKHGVEQKEQKENRLI